MWLPLTSFNVDRTDHHPSFIRGRADLCKFFNRIKIKGRSKSIKQSPLPNHHSNTRWLPADLISASSRSYFPFVKGTSPNSKASLNDFEETEKALPKLSPFRDTSSEGLYISFDITQTSMLTSSYPSGNEIVTAFPDFECGSYSRGLTAEPQIRNINTGGVSERAVAFSQGLRLFGGNKNLDCETHADDDCFQPRLIEEMVAKSIILSFYRRDLPLL